MTGRIPAGGGGNIPQIHEERFTASGTWTKPAGVDWVEITLVGGGGAGTQTSPGLRPGGGGGAGQFLRKIVPVAGPVPVVIGAGGTAVPAATPAPIAPGGGNTIWGSPSPVVALGGNSLQQQGFSSGAGGRGSQAPNPENGAMGGGGGGASSSGSHQVFSPFFSRYTPTRSGGVGGQFGFGGGEAIDGANLIHPATGFGPFSALAQNGGEGIENFAGGGGGGGYPTTLTGTGSGGFGGGGGNASGRVNSGGGGGAGGSGGSGIAIVRYRE